MKKEEYRLTLKGLLSGILDEWQCDDVLEKIELHLLKHYRRDGCVPAILLTDNGFIFARVMTDKKRRTG